MWKEGGFTQFIPFVVTAVSVVSLDLLKGVGIGLAISIFYILRENMKIPFYYNRSTFSNGELIKISLAQEVSFLNKASIKETLEKIPEGSSVIIDATNTEYIDFDVLDLVREFYVSKAPEKNIKMSLVGFRNVYKIPDADSEGEIVAGFGGNNETPIKTSGDYKKLLKQLAEMEEVKSNP
jgi:MFS superfamily sulfate permease-like transporter